MTPIPPGPIALLDACVLHSNALRDFLVRLAIEGAYRPRWTERIHGEWQASVLKRYKHVKAENLATTRARMEEQFEDALVRGYESAAHTYTLPDEDDRHVLAAAVACGAEYVVTENLKHFPPTFLGPYGVKAIRPDAFAVEIFRQDSERVLAAVRRQRRALSKPPRTAEEHLAALENCGLKKLAACLRPFSASL